MSIPSVNVRAPPPPPQQSMKTCANGSPWRSSPAMTGQLIPGDQHACASVPSSSEAMSIFAKALATTSCVESVVMIDAMLTPAGLSALLSVPSSETISMIRRPASTAQGRS